MSKEINIFISLIRKKFKKIIDFSSKNKFLLFLIAFSIFLIFSGLTNRALWRDEAGTATIARNVLNNGGPSVFDGKNFVATLSSDYNKDLISTKPPLTYYVEAFSLFLFGENTFAARIPFAVFGVLTILFTYLVCLKLTSNKNIARISAFLLTVSVFFIVHSRNARYYSLSAFLTILSTYFYLDFLKEKRSKYKLALSSILLFYTQPFPFFGLMSSFSIHYLLVNKKKTFNRENLKNLLIISLIILTFIFPYIYYIGCISPPINQHFFLSNKEPLEKIFFNNLDKHSIILFQITPMILFFFIPFALFDNIFSTVKKRKNFLSLNRPFVLILSIITITLFLTCLVKFPFGPQPRHIVGMVPFLFIFCSIIIYKLSKSKMFIVVILVFLLFFSLPLIQSINPSLDSHWTSEYGEKKDLADTANPLCYNVMEEIFVHSKIHKYIYGILREYKTGYSDGTRDISNYLRARGDKNDTVYCSEYSLVRNLMFTTDMQIFPFTLYRQKYKELFPDEKPDFILADRKGEVQEEWRDYAKTNCTKEIIKVHLPFRGWDANRPRFGITSYYDYKPNPRLQDFVIYECPKNSSN